MVLISFKLYARIDEMTYPKAENIIAIFGIKVFWVFEVKLPNVSNPIIKNTPIKPTIIEINFNNVNLSSLVKKWDNKSAKIGATESSNPAVLDWIYCSDQLIKKKGINEKNINFGKSVSVDTETMGLKFPISPMIIIKKIFFFDKLNLYPLNKQKE